MKYSLIRLEKHLRIGFITLSRAEKKNALNDQLVTELTAALDELKSDNSVKVIVMKAEGDVFSAGADLDYLKKLQSFSFEENLTDTNQFRNLFIKLFTHPKIIIAQVEGHAIAGGCGLASICDFCFAVPEAKFGYTEVKIGFIPALVSVFLIRKISGTKVRELLLTGKLISADEACNIGLINKVVSKEMIESHVHQFAVKLCEETSSQSITSTKEMLSRIFSMDLNEALNYAAQMNAKTRLSDDCQKGISDFLNKEKTSW